MSAPGVSAFGDGSHAPGATGLAVDGGGFGAFPGSVWIYENSDLSGAADELTVTAWDDLQVTVSIPGSLTNTAGTRYLFVQREDLAWSNGLAFTLEASGGVTLVVADCSHDHAVDNVTLAGPALVVADALHAHEADNLALFQANVLAAQDATHGHAVDSVTLILGLTLEVADSAHAHTADGVVLRFPGRVVPTSRVLVVERSGQVRRISA